MGAPSSKAEAVARAKRGQRTGAVMLAIIVVMVAAGWAAGPVGGALLIWTMVMLALQSRELRRTQRLPDFPAPKPMSQVSLDFVRKTELAIWGEPFHCNAYAHVADAQAGRLQLLGIDGECPVCRPRSDGDGLGVQDQGGSTPRPRESLTRRRRSDTPPMVLPPGGMWAAIEVTSLGSATREYVYYELPHHPGLGIQVSGGYVTTAWDVLHAAHAGAWQRLALAVLADSFRGADPRVSCDRIRKAVAQAPDAFTGQDGRLFDALLDRYEECELKLPRRRRPPDPE